MIFFFAFDSFNNVYEYVILGYFGFFNLGWIDIFTRIFVRTKYMLIVPAIIS